MDIMQVFWAHQLENSEDLKFRIHRKKLNPQVIEWLSKNLRKRSTDKGRRYRYVDETYAVNSTDLRGLGVKRTIPGKRLRFHVGVQIFDEQDVLAFKLRWL